MTKELVVHVRQPDQLLELMERIQAIKPWPREGIDVSCARHKVRLTAAQNRRMWWLHNLEAAHLNATWPERSAALVAMMEQAGASLGKLERMMLIGKVWNKDDCHEQFKKRYFAGKSTRKQSKLDVMAVLDEYEADLRTGGVQFPETEAWRDAA